LPLPNRFDFIGIISIVSKPIVNTRVVP